MEPDFSWTTGGQPNIAHTRWIDRGGSGAVHEMRHTTTGLVFARKIIRPTFGPASVSDILREVKVFQKLSEGDTGHPCIVRIYGHGWLPRSTDYYLDMELCSFNLDKWIRENKAQNHASCALAPHISSKNNLPRRDEVLGIDERLSPAKSWEILEESLSIILQINCGLVAIHNHNLVHRDLNPRNVLYSPTMRLWKIADFGITQDGTAETPLVTTSCRGTAGYRAPELLMESPLYTNKVDVWAFGCIVFEIMKGRKRFASDWEVQNLAQSSELVSNLVPDDEKLDKSVRGLVEATLKTDWTARPTCAENHESLLTIGALLIRSIRVPRQTETCEHFRAHRIEWHNDPQPRYRNPNYLHEQTRFSLLCVMEPLYYLPSSTVLLLKMLQRRLRLSDLPLYFERRFPDPAINHSEVFGILVDLCQDSMWPFEHPPQDIYFRTEIWDTNLL